MKEVFSCYAIKWEIDNEGLHYVKKTYPFESMKNVKIKSTPSLLSSTGTVAFSFNKGFPVSVNYVKKDHERVVKLVDEINKMIENQSFPKDVPPEPVSKPKVIQKEAVYSLKATEGKDLDIYDDYCCLKENDSLMSFVIDLNTSGNKEIYYSDIIGVQYKLAEENGTIGYIQLETATVSGKKLFTNFYSENSFSYKHTDLPNELVVEAINYIKQRVAASKSNNTPQPAFSSADELMKFKQLLDMGAITKEEFEQKKKELLNL